MKRLIKLCCCLMLCLCACDKQPEEPVKEVENIELVSNETYADPVNANNAYKKVFNQLSEDLKKDDMESLSENVAMCFVYDFFTLKNKENSSDIGGLAYLPQNRTEEFAQFASIHYYKNYDSIVQNYGVNSLPEVVNVRIDSKLSTEVDYLNETYDGYEYEISVEYADTKLSQDELKTKMKLTCLVYNHKAMVISVN